MIGSGGSNKKYENQAGYNDLFDDGKVSKMYRNQGLNYGIKGGFDRGELLHQRTFTKRANMKLSKAKYW